MYETPELAIQTFERIHRLRVTVHDVRGSMWAFLAPERFSHTAPLCVAVKWQGGQSRCVDFEITKLRQELPETPDGRVHVCHAGFVEWTVPVFRGTDFEWVLFAGIRLPGSSLRPSMRDRVSIWREKLQVQSVEWPETVEESESNDILEHLRQLAARLSAWVHAMENNHPVALKSSSSDQDNLAQRRTTIRRHIALNHTGPLTLADLAAHLSLSESRASHAISECCGASFQDLVQEARLRTAMGLLRHSALSVLEVALNSGFRDLAHFHRLFRRSVGISPAKFRKSVAS